MASTHQYLIYIRADNLEEGTEQALHLAYWFLTQALREHRRNGQNGRYETFAVETLALLQQYRDLYTTSVGDTEIES